ncbi:DUF6986 family protein [Actinokineospora xionganensis]|uniref:Aldolase n=1 Tax=Actinokineospora xionganensis TaxID=2684470 RepID=A0ABR7LDR5_9PSEU|nr:aldolase/citrate lyase family protein [Actinokineospora xionganensis]MBC6450738.1 aldolase [Actinokineospora xionganensis]
MRTIDGSFLAVLTHRLSEVDRERSRRYPGDQGGRQPVHTCYVPADKITDDLPARWGAQALAAFDEHLPDPAAVAAIIGVPAALAATVYERVRAKLEREPVEDLRVDFEDGYGNRDDETEDGDAAKAATLMGAWGLAGVGIRMKSFDTAELTHRAVHTLDVVLTDLGTPPPGFVITFPKVTGPEQVTALVELLELCEQRLEWPEGSLRFEIQIETTQAVIDHKGRFAVPRLIDAGAGRVSGLHFGTYDYTAACGLSAADQHLAHPACDFARNAMQVGASGTGVRLSDGSSNVLPVGDNVRHGWLTHYKLVRRSLSRGFFQGWDLHPAQLVSRYCAVFTHHLETAEGDGARLAAYMSRTTGSILDEPATAAALATSLTRAIDCGALTEAEVTGYSGLTPDSLTALSRRH